MNEREINAIKGGVTALDTAIILLREGPDLWWMRQNLSELRAVLALHKAHDGRSQQEKDHG